MPTPEEGIFPPPNIFAARDGLTDLEIAAIAAAHPTGAPIVDLPAINSDTTLFPGHYTTTGGNPSIRVNGGNVTLNAGTYVVDGFTFNGGTITGDPLGVTFYNKGNQLTTIAGTATAILSAPAVNTADPEGDLNSRISILALARSQDTPPLRRIPRLFALNPAHHLRR